MKKAKLKTAPSKLSATKYLNNIEDGMRKNDCLAIAKMMQTATKSDPVMWGKSIVGFGNKELTYASGRVVDWFIVGFSSRKNDISLYLTCNLDQLDTYLKKLGTYKRGVGCLYIKTLDDIDTNVLKKMIAQAKKLKV